MACLLYRPREESSIFPGGNFLSIPLLWNNFLRPVEVKRSGFSISSYNLHGCLPISAHAYEIITISFSPRLINLRIEK